MTCFLTPDGVPFYAGTYFPPAPAHGMPSFTQVLTAIRDTWRDQRDSVTEAAGRIGAALAESVTTSLPPAALDAAALERLVDALARDFDRVNGGFGRAPKFPPAMLGEFLLRHHERTGSTAALAMVDATLDAMARGGIYDQLAGGFARYSVDAHWHVPHFEKMLSDNALLLRLYAHHALAHRVRPFGTDRGGGRSVLVGRDAVARRLVRCGAGRGHRRRRGADVSLDGVPDP